MDLREIYATRQTTEAVRYFNELDASAQAALIARYNAQQSSPALRLARQTSRLAQAAFFRWLSVDTWGEPSDAQVHAFARAVRIIR